MVAGNLLRENDETQGFNAATDTYENLVKAGVIDPTKVVAKPHERTDTRLKNYPYRGSPIEGPK